MPNPHDTLSIFAEVAVALAGFSGIIIAFGRRPSGALTPLELRRLSNLFVLSGFVLISSLLGVSLLYIESLEPTTFWSIGSATVFLLVTPWLILDWRKVTRLEEEERAEVKAYVIYPFNFLAVVVLLLQIANVFVISKSWPFFLALALATTFAFQQFILLVRMGFRDA
jgi:hypothetical protein